ncbi:MAG: hypothetical protein QW272_09345 [Candidatus Methanomethylicaceae archaeon]
MTTDITNKIVYARPEEATSIGNILLQATGLGIIKSLRELREYVKNSYEIRVFKPKHTKEYEDACTQFLSIVGYEKCSNNELS